MSKLAVKVATPIILAGVFAITIFIALDYERLGLSFFIVLLLLTLFVFFFGFAIGQNFSSPIKKLLERATELSRGNLSSRAYIETKDELSQLAKVFNEIAEELEQSRCQEQSAEKSVDLKVRARTQALEETINALEQKVRNRTIEQERLLSETQKLQQQTKTKEKELTQLKNEFSELKSKMPKPKIIKKVQEENADA
jgi:methyl-accepting chemotaxis protein